MTALRELVHLTPIYEQVDSGWVQATILEMPGVITAAPSREEAQDSLVDALREFLLSFQEESAAQAPLGRSDGFTLTIKMDDPAPS